MDKDIMKLLAKIMEYMGENQKQIETLKGLVDINSRQIDLLNDHFDRLDGITSNPKSK